MIDRGAWWMAALALSLAGCSGTTLDTSYGRMRGASLNGTGVVAELFREEGHTVRAALRLTDELEEWAEVIVRFAPYPGPPEKAEADWYAKWLDAQPGRRLIYVPRDFDAQHDYWTAVLDRLPKDADPKLRERAAARKRKSATWATDLPPRPKGVADPEQWFAVEAPAPTPAPVVCKALGGPWAEGVDPARAAVTRHETIKLDAETLLLEGDAKPLAVEWTRYNASQVLVVASGAFLLNEPLVNPARRPLARRVVLWAGDEPRDVAFVEGRFLLGSATQLPWPPPSNWVLAQLLVLGLAASLAAAARLGRPRPEPPPGEDRPAAHPEALGTLLARVKRPDEARARLDEYRRWRHGAGPRGPADPA